MKRVLDILVSGVTLIVLAPVMIVIALLVRVRLGSPILFRQRRAGLRGELFTMTKFRTMTDDTDEHGTLLPDAARLTKLGRFLRSTSLDELPTLWCVLVGSMSLVGPRPLLVSYLPLYSVTHSRRHEVRPGITGLAQISGRNALSWEDRLDLDVVYVDTQSMRLDLRILARTVWSVIGREGISADGHATMPEYRGGSTLAD